MDKDTRKVYTKKELLEMGFAFDLNGNISTPDECYERAEKYYEYRKKRFIDKVCEYLNKNIFQSYTYNAGNKIGNLTVNNKFTNKEDFIKNFRKAMEE